MYILTWKINIGTYRLETVKSVKIITSVLNLSDTATIELPGQYLNTWKKIEDKVKVGDAVDIQLGYDGDNRTEFRGYLKRILRDDNSLKIECEDALFLLHKSVRNREYKNITVKKLLNDLLGQVDGSLKLECDYEMTYEKFTTFHTTALDVLKKVQEETKANIWFEDKTLYIRPVYAENTDIPAVIYDTRINVQSNDLKWIAKDDRKVEIEVTFTNAAGEKKSKKYGTPGGVTKTKVIRPVNEADMMKAAENEYTLWNYSGFEGSFTAWLIPRVQAGGTVILRDTDREEGKYYVTGVEIDFSTNGAKRKITLGRKLG
jgi:hypothetical protein